MSYSPFQIQVQHGPGYEEIPGTSGWSYDIFYLVDTPEGDPDRVDVYGVMGFESEQEAMSDATSWLDTALCGLKKVLQERGFSTHRTTYETLSLLTPQDIRHCYKRGKDEGV